LFVIPTIGFKLLYRLVILRRERRRLVWTNVTTNPTAKWIARQLAEAFPWDETPRISSETETRRMVPLSRADYELWAFETGRSRHARRGRTVMLNG
jgi:hypothetical protein